MSELDKAESFNIKLAPESRELRSAAVIWDKLSFYTQIKRYEIMVNGDTVASSTNIDYTLENISPEKEYTVKVKAYGEKEIVLAESNELLIPSCKIPAVYNIADYGAIGDGKTLNTQAIQNAIDDCTDYGIVRIPKGNYASGALFLKSKITLEFEEGSRLLGSPNLSDYPLMVYRFEGKEQLCYASLINTKEAGENRLDHIHIIGKGTIDANGALLRKQQLEEQKGKPGRAVCLRHIDGIYLKDITIRQSPAWCLHLIDSSDITLNGVHIFTKWDENGNRYEGIANGDGFDPDSCRNINVFHSEIASQDDCIAIKSGKDEEGRRVNKPSENIHIFDCIFRSGFGVAAGSEMSGGVRNVLVEDCTFQNTFSIASIKAPRDRGSYIENITYRDITMDNKNPEHKDCRWFRGAIYVDNFYSHEIFDPSAEEPVSEATPSIHDITFENITLTTCGGHSIWLAGLKESPLKNIRLHNITATGTEGFSIFNVESLSISNVETKVLGE